MDIKNLIEAERLIYASVILPLLVQIMAIIRTNADILLTEHLGTNFSEILWVYILLIHFHSRKCIENVIWKMASILSRPPCVKWLSTTSVHFYKPNTSLWAAGISQ